MAEFLEKYIRTRLVFGKATPLLKTVVSAVIVLSAMVLVTMRLNTWQAEERIQELRERAVVLEMENARLQQQVDDLGTVESIRTIAAQELERMIIAASELE